MQFVPARAFRRASGALRTFAFSERIFVARLFRGCFVLSSLTPAVGFSSVWRVRFRSRFFDSWNRPRARAENVLASGAGNNYRADSCRPSVRCPALEDDVFAVVTRARGFCGD